MSFPTFETLVWHRDNAATGWRSRAFVDGGFELIAYDDGQWFTCKSRQCFASGRAPSHDQAKHAAWTALELTDSLALLAELAELRDWKAKYEPIVKLHLELAGKTEEATKSTRRYTLADIEKALP